MSSNVRLRKELSDLKKSPLPYCTAEPENDDLHIWKATINGSEGTPYHGGKFILRLSFDENYPFDPPKVKFITKIYHPNINSKGLICLDILRQSSWSAVLTTQKILLSIISLLSDPNPDDPLCPEIGKLCKNNRKKYNETAKKWTEKYAMNPDT